MNVVLRLTVVFIVSLSVSARETPPQEPEPGDHWESPSGIVFTWIPGGSFVMGTDAEEAAPDQRPAHSVELDGFWMSVTEIPNSIYDLFKKGHSEQTGYVTTSEEPDEPAVMVSWDDAVSFCSWLCQRENLVSGLYDLPTEAQWERASKGDDNRPYPWGRDIGSEYANVCDMNCAFEAIRTYMLDDGYAFMAPVDSFPAGASPYGCLNMAGNVREWCKDFYQVEFYRSSPDRNPTGPKKGTLRVLRGGGFNHPMIDCMTTSREAALPVTSQIDIGFRIIRRPS